MFEFYILDTFHRLSTNHLYMKLQSNHNVSRGLLNKTAAESFTIFYTQTAFLIDQEVDCS